MKVWKYPKINGSLSIAKENPLLAKLLLLRDINTDKKAEEFLNPETKAFLPFYVFKDSQKVITRIDSAIQNNDKVIIYGDFDTDGVTSTAILYKVLKASGCNVEKYIPNRDEENHGLNTKALIKLISKEKAKLIITVDCGISNISEIKLANSFKTDIIITDHHEAPEILPEAYAIINPKAKNTLIEDISSEDISSLCNLSGAGIAFKLSLELIKKYNKDHLTEEILAIAAVGTIGDVVPLNGENRHIVYSGLKALKNKVNKGLTKLFINAGISDFDKINSETVAFTAVPRINAAGRLQNAEISFNLLTTEDENELEKITYSLNQLNSERQNLCNEAFERAFNIVQEQPELYSHAIVICDEKAHIGIIGLSASKLVETFTKPAFVMKKDANIYRCSCRGLSGINIFEILNENKDLFLGFGGHEFAGGFSFDSTVVSFEQVREAINNSVTEQTNGESLQEIINIDANLSTNEISYDIIETVNLLEPFGAANPRPLFTLKNLEVSSYKFIGQNKNHLKLYCTDKNGIQSECVKWSEPNFKAEFGEKIDIVFSPELNIFNGKTSIQLLLKDYILSNSTNECKTNLPKIIDCRTQKGGFDKIIDFMQHSKKNTGIYCNKKEHFDYFGTFEISKNKIYNKNNIPNNLDMIIFVDMPDSLEFIKSLFKKNIKEMLFMYYDENLIDIKNIIAKIAGMLKYTHNSLEGKTNLTNMQKALICDEEIILQTIKLLTKAGFADLQIIDKKEIIINKINPISIEKIKSLTDYTILDSMISKYNKHIEKIKNSSNEEFKKYLLQ